MLAGKTVSPTNQQFYLPVAVWVATICQYAIVVSGALEGPVTACLSKSESLPDGKYGAVGAAASSGAIIAPLENPHKGQVK